LALWVGGIGIIYAALFNQSLNEFLPFLTIGFVVWTYLAQTITDGGNAFVFAEGYIKQFTYPKQVYILRILVAANVPLLIGICVFFFVIWLLHRPVGWGMLWVLPGMVLIWIASYLQATIMAYASVRFRDLPHGMSALLQILFFVTPVFFSIDLLERRGLDFVYALNPLYYLIEVVRHPLTKLEMAPTGVYLAVMAYIFFLFVVTVTLVKRLDKRIVYIL
jgi:ABC-type polysaccharide/polyol phosphate export permease